MCEMRLAVLLGTHSVIILFLILSCSWTLGDEGEEAHPASLGQIQGQLYLRQHCIKPIIHDQGLFSATVNVLFTRLKRCSEWGVIYGAGGRNCKHVFLSPPYKRINKNTAGGRFNSEKPLCGTLRCTKKLIAKSLQLAEYAFIF